MADPQGLPLVNTNTNQVEQVPWDNAHDALTTGTHNLQSGQSVNIVNPDGNLVSLPSEQVPDALQSGYKIPGQATITEHNNQQQFGEGAGNEAKAFAAGVARGPSFGLSDLALTKSGLVDPNTLQQLEQRNPVASTLGQLGGIAATAGEGLVGKVAQLGEEVTHAVTPVAEKLAQSLANPETSPIVAKILAAAGKTGAKTLGSAVEGSAYGLGNAVTEHALGDPDTNGENLLHNVGYGALFGGALGATLGLGEQTYKGLKGTFGKEIAKAANKDAIIENSALNPTPQNINPPNSLEEIQGHLKNAFEQGYGEELPAKSRLLETNGILAGDSQYPAHSLQVQSLTSPSIRDGYKVALENPQNADGQTLRAWEAVQKQEGTQKLIPQFIQEISPESKIISDEVEGGNHAIKAFTDQYSQEKNTLAPYFKQFDNQAVTLVAEPQAVLSKIDSAIPDAGRYMMKDPDGYGIAPYKKSMPFSKEVHDELSGLLDELNKPEGVTIADLRNVRESMRDKVNFLTAPRTSAQISSLRKSVMDLIQDEVQKSAPQWESVEGLNSVRNELGDPRELFKRYAQNEESRSIIEQIMGGSIGDVKSFAREIKPEEALNRIFGNTIYVKAAKDILGPDFDKIAANWISQKVKSVTDVAKNGFSSNKFATFLKQKSPELEEALATHPDQLNKLRAITDKMRILPDSPSVNPSGTAKTGLIQKMQNLGGYLGKDGLTAIPGKVMGALGEKYGEMKQHSEFNRILRSGMDENQQSIDKIKQYGAFSRIERFSQETASKISRGINAVIKGPEGSGVRGIATQKLIPHDEELKKYDKLEAHLKDMSSNSDKFTDVLQNSIQALNNIAPNITGSLSMAAVRATQFLASKLPAQVPSSPLSPPYKPSKSELAKFNRYVSIVENPLHVIQQLKTGDLTSESLETLQQVYPKLLYQMQQEVLSKLDEKTMAKLPYQTKIMFSAFLGRDLDNSLAQPNIAAAQMAGNPMQPPQQSAKPKEKVGPSQKGLGKLDQSNQYLTAQQQANQRIERS